MSSYPTTLVCTVGTSLFVPNLIGLDPEKKFMYEPAEQDGLGRVDKQALERSGLWNKKAELKALIQAIKSAYEARRWTDLGAKLAKLPADLRLCGAEINSIEAMIRKGFLPQQRHRLVLFVSDTPDGQALGEILCAYFLHGNCSVGFEDCRYRTVEGLQDEKPLVFQREGLTNLVRLLGDELRKWGSEWIAINATGGYKAQIALAVAFGQATRCPVYYKHERFDQIIRFPRIPFTIDLGLVANNLKLWAGLAEPGAAFSAEEMNSLLNNEELLKESIVPMLDTIEERGTRYYALSALGTVYWEAFLSLNPRAALLPERVADRKGCRFPEHHYPEGFEGHVEKVYHAFPEWVSECHTLPFSGQKAIQGGRFLERDGKLIGEYVDKNGFGARFELLTTAKNQLERNWVISTLNDWLKGQ